MPSQGTPEFLSPTSSCPSSPEVPSDVRELSSNGPSQSTPNVFSNPSDFNSDLGDNSPVPPPPPSDDPLQLGTRSSLFSASYSSFQKRSTGSADLKQQECIPDVTGRSSSSSPSPSTPELLRTSPPSQLVASSPASPPTTPISLSLNDSPAGFKELLGTLSPPPAPVKPSTVTPLAPGRKCIGLSAPSLPEVKTAKRLASNDLRHRLVKGTIPGFGAGVPSTDSDCLVGDFGDTSGVVGNSAGRSHLMVRSRTSNLCLEIAAHPSSSPVVPTISPTESCVVSIAVTKSCRGYLSKCNMALARMKQMCLDSEEVCQPSPPVPPTVPPSAVSPSVPPLVECSATDVRHVIVQDVRQVVDVSESPIDVSASASG